MPFMDRSINKAIVFYAITLALAIAVRLAVPLIGEASLPVTMMTPAVASLIMLTLIAPEGGFRDALKSLGLDRAGLKGWPLAIGGPVAIFAAGLALMAITGLTALVVPEVPGGVFLAIVDLLVGLVVSTLFALCEEVGWRGYMLPRMAGVALVPAMLITGFLHGLWHMPILLTTDYYHSSGSPFIIAPMFLLTLTLAGLFYGYLRVWTVSVWPVALAHGAANSAWNISNAMSGTKSALVSEYIGGESGVVTISGLLVIGFVLIRIMRDKALLARF